MKHSFSRLGIEQLESRQVLSATGLGTALASAGADHRNDAATAAIMAAQNRQMPPPTPGAATNGAPTSNPGLPVAIASAGADHRNDAATDALNAALHRLGG